MKQFLMLSVAMACVSLHAGAREYVYETGPFDALSQEGNINVVYSTLPDSIGTAHFSSDKDLSEAFELTNDNGRLKIRESRNHGFGPLPTLYVYSQYVTDIKQEGKSTVKADLGCMTPKLNVRLTGNGKVTVDGVSTAKLKASIVTGNGTIALAGVAGEATYELLGTGVIQADRLEAQSVKCTVGGTGAIGCWPVKTLDVKGIGTTKIYYKGDPVIKKLGGAKLSPMPKETKPEAVSEEAPDNPILEEDLDEDVTIVTAD